MTNPTSTEPNRNSFSPTLSTYDGTW